MSTIETLAASTATASAASAGASTQKSDAGSAERFLKLLVTQLQNQDPMNPLDNAQITSQIAQINTVSGIEKLNTTMQSMVGRFGQLQAVQGAALVGRDVLVEGSQLTRVAGGPSQGGFELSSAADSVKVEILGGGGTVIDSLELGAEGAGRHAFEWMPRAGADPAAAQSFRIIARAGTAPVGAVPLMRDRVESVATDGNTLTLDLRQSGSVPYAQVKAFN